MSQSNSADALIEQLGFRAHPEGGWYLETWRAEAGPAGRAQGTAILFLLKAEEVSHWHRVDADEMWIWQGGDPLELSIADDDDGPVRTLVLGRGMDAVGCFQGLVPKGAWQAAQPVPNGGGDGGAGYCLVSCVVVPGFEFAGFELAPPGWAPGRDAGA
jgi:predicted cupin superfamily sugar epimerase